MVLREEFQATQTINKQRREKLRSTVVKYITLIISYNTTTRQLGVIRSFFKSE